MFGIDKKEDTIRFVKAFLTNQYARIAPRSYIKYTNETGRGSQWESVKNTAEYFRLSFNEYLKYLKVSEEDTAEFLFGKRILEYGPGDLPGVALLYYAMGAEKVYCVDRFPLISFSEFNAAVLNELIGKMTTEHQQRAKSCFNHYGEPKSGLKKDCIEYIINKNGLSCLNNEVDIICSRAVLEHVNDLHATFKDMDMALKPDGVVVHKVDLKSHGMHRTNPLDFLTWPAVLWHLMYSKKGVPNRWRLNQYRKAFANTKLKLELIESIEKCNKTDVDEVRPYLAKQFVGLSDDDLSCLSFWMKAVK